MINHKDCWSICLIMIPTLYFGFVDNTAAMLVSLTAGLISAVFINLDKFDSFKAGDGKLEAQLKKSIEEASATIDQLNSVAIPLIKANLTTLSYAGSFENMPVEVKEELFYELKKIKESLNLNDLNKKVSLTAKGIANSYFCRIYYEVRELDMEFDKKYHKYSLDENKYSAPPIEELDLFFENNPKYFKNGIKTNYEKFKKISMLK